MRSTWRVRNNSTAWYGPEVNHMLVCGGEARRVFSVAMIRGGSRPALSAAIDQAEKSRHQPAVVTSLPSTGSRKRTPVAPLPPALRRLPRP